MKISLNGKKIATESRINTEENIKQNSVLFRASVALKQKNENFTQRKKIATKTLVDF